MVLGVLGFMDRKLKTNRLLSGVFMLHIVTICILSSLPKPPSYTIRGSYKEFVKVLKGLCVLALKAFKVISALPSFWGGFIDFLCGGI